jgi:hypothetical protein
MQMQGLLLSPSISRGCCSPAHSITKQPRQQLHDDRLHHWVNMIHGCNILYSSKIAVMIKLQQHQQQQQQQQSCSTASSPGAAAS